MSNRVRSCAIVVLTCLLAGCPFQAPTFTVRVFNQSTNVTVSGLYIGKGAPGFEYVTSNLISQPLNGGQSTEVIVRLSDTAGGEGVAATYSNSTKLGFFSALQVPFEADMVINITVSGNAMDPMHDVVVDQAGV